jgi:hypothetical protein
MNTNDLSQDNRIIAHRLSHRQPVYGRDAFAQRFDPRTGRDRDVFHLVIGSALEQPAMGTIEEEEIQELNQVPSEEGGFSNFSARSDWK